MKRSTSNQGEPSKKKLKSQPLRKYELAYVVNNLHKKQVEERVHVCKVPADTGGYEHVRRNKKIMKLRELKKSSLPNLKEVASTKKPLDTIEVKFRGKGIYDHEMVDILKEPESFIFSQAKSESDLWNVSKKGKEDNILITTDFSQEDLKSLKPELENDVGILKTSAEYVANHRNADVAPLTSHPGHHAGPKQIANYCVINNAIVSAAMIKKLKPQWKIGVLDLDAHPGDGTKQLVEQNEDLIARYVSFHSKEEFINMETFRGKENAVVMAGKIPWKKFDSMLAKTLKSLEHSELNVLIVCIGFDTLKDDPTGGKHIGFQLLPLQFQKIGAQLAQQHAQVLFIQEGGYDCNLTAEAFGHLMEGFNAGRKIHAINQI